MIGVGLDKKKTLTLQIWSKVVWKDNTTLSEDIGMKFGIKNVEF